MQISSGFRRNLLLIYRGYQASENQQVTYLFILPGLAAIKDSQFPFFALGMAIVADDFADNSGSLFW